MELSISKKDNIAYVTPQGKLDATTAEPFEKQVIVAIQETPRALLDLSALNYISSAGLRVILLMSKTTSSAGGKLAISGMSGIVADVFSMSGFDSMIKTFATSAEAEAYLRQ